MPPATPGKDRALQSTRAALHSRAVFDQSASYPEFANRQIVDIRNKKQLSFYAKDELATVYKRNLDRYGNAMGPTYESQVAKYGSPEAVIRAGYRTNPTMDILTGIARIRRTFQHLIEDYVT